MSVSSREVKPLPKVDEMLAQLSGAKIFSELDANSGFWQISLAQQSRLLTTFITSYGHIALTSYPLEHQAHPNTFKSRWAWSLRDLKVLSARWMMSWYWQRPRGTQCRLAAVLRRIQAAGATLNPDKCNKTEIPWPSHRWENHPGWPRENICDPVDGPSHKHFWTETIHWDGQPSGEILQKTGTAHTTPSWAPQQEAHLAVGAHPGPSISRGQGRTSKADHTHSLQSRGREKDLSWFFQSWTRSCPAAKEWVYFEACRICFLFHDRDGTLLCPNRKERQPPHGPVTNLPATSSVRRLKLRWTINCWYHF